MLDLALVHLGRTTGFLFLGRQGDGLHAAKVLRDGFGNGSDVGQGVFLKQKFEGNDLIELDARNAPHEALRHGLVSTDVEVLDAVELSVRRTLERVLEAVDLGLVVVDLHHEFSALIEPLDAHVVELSGQKVLLGEHHLLPLETEVEDQAQVAGIGDHQGQVFFADVGVGAQQESLGIRGGEADVDLLGDGGLVVSLKVVADHVVRPHVDADFVGADGAFEGRPAAVAGELRVLFLAFAAVHAGVGGALAHAPHAHAVQAPWVLGGLADQVDGHAVQDHGAHASHEAVRQVALGSDEQVVVEQHGADGTTGLPDLAFPGAVDHHHGLFPVPLHQHRVPAVVVQAVGRLDGHALGTFSGLVFELDVVAAEKGQADEVSGLADAVDQDHGLVPRRLELQVNVAALSHVEGRQLHHGVVLAERHHVVEQNVAVALQRAQGVAPLLSVQRVARVAEVQGSHRQILFLRDLAAVPQPVVVAGVAVAPLVGVEANAEDAALALLGAGQRSGPVVHDAVLARDPVAVGRELGVVVDRRVEQTRPLAVVAQFLDAAARPVDQGLHHVHAGVVVDGLLVAALLLEPVHLGGVLVHVADVRDVAPVREKLAADRKRGQRSGAVDVDDRLGVAGLGMGG